MSSHLRKLWVVALALGLLGSPSAHAADSATSSRAGEAAAPSLPGAEPAAPAASPAPGVPPASGAADNETLKPAVPLNQPGQPATNAPSAAEEQARIRNRVHSGGISLGWSPIYKPKVSDQLGGTFSSGFELGIHMPDAFVVGFRYAHGTATQNSSAPKGVTVVTPSHTLLEGFIEGDIPLNAPYRSLGPVQLVLPLYFAGYENIVKGEGGTTSYGNIGLDLATGLGARVHTKSPFVFELAGLYHLGLSLWDVRQDALSTGLTGPNGDTVNGSTSGFEMRMRAIVFFNGPF